VLGVQDYMGDVDARLTLTLALELLPQLKEAVLYFILYVRI
jgi:hypothetical protein